MTEPLCHCEEPKRRRSNLFSKSLITATLIFIGCLCVGFWIAGHRPLWNDEYYSQIRSVQNISFADQFLGHVPEGGNSPLFYSVQKLFLQLVHFQTPPGWIQGQYNDDSHAQTILRINPVVFMSLSVGLVFFYFFSAYSAWTAFYSLFIYISSYMLWAYWAEARPYALLVFLTTLQSVVFLRLMDQRPRTSQDQQWIILAVTNILLGLTSILSLGEILAVSFLWGVFKERDWKKYIFVTLLPVMIVFFYCAHAPKYPFYFGLSPEQLVRDNIPRQSFDLFFIFLILLSVYAGGRKNQKIQNILGEELFKALPYVIFTGLVLASTAAVLCLFAMHAKPGIGFPITSRYFIYLTPIGVMATTLLTVSLIKSLSKFYLMQWLLMGLAGFLFIQHFLKIVPPALRSLM